MARRPTAKRTNQARHAASAKDARPMRKPVRRTPEWLTPVATVGGIAILVLVFLAYRWWTTPAPPTISTDQTALVLNQITNIQASELEQVAMGSAKNSIKAVNGPALTGAGGKPEVFYLGAEYCPYCAAERWSMIIALSRFGTFTGLQTTTSSTTDVYPNTPTFTFRHATYSSPYVDFQAVETTDRNQNPLQSPTAAQSALLSKYGSGSIPFVDFGNRYSLSGSTYLPDTMSGMTWQQVADALQQPGTPQAKAILGSANLITAAICQITNQQPSAVCSGTAIQAIEPRLGTGH